MIWLFGLLTFSLFVTSSSPFTFNISKKNSWHCYLYFLSQLSPDTIATLVASFAKQTLTEFSSSHQLQILSLHPCIPWMMLGTMGSLCLTLIAIFVSSVAGMCAMASGSWFRCYLHISSKRCNMGGGWSSWYVLDICKVRWSVFPVLRIALIRLLWTYISLTSFRGLLLFYFQDNQCQPDVSHSL